MNNNINKTSRNGSASGSSVENNVNSFYTNDKSNNNNNGDNMKNINIFTSRNGSVSGSDVENNVKGFNTNNKKGYDVSDYILSKKQFKKLSKKDAYIEYLTFGEKYVELHERCDEARSMFLESKQIINRVNEANIKQKMNIDKLTKKTEEVGREADRVKRENEKVKRENQELKRENEKLEMEVVEANARADAGFELTEALQADIDKCINERNEDFEAYTRINDRMTGKKARANINTGTIRHYKNIISGLRKEIESGKNVGSNKATINELEAEIRNLQRQVNAANETFYEMKSNKIDISEKIVELDEKIDKYYKVNNLLEELGYEGVLNIE